MNKKVIKVLVIILTLICSSIVIFSLVNKTDYNDKNNKKDDTTIVNDDEKNIIDSFSNEISFNQTDHIIKIEYYKVKDDSNLYCEILIDDNVILQRDDIEEVVFPNEEDMFLINGNDEKEYLVIKISELDKIEKIYIINETNLLGELDIDLAFQIENLEGENKDLYFVNDNLYSQYVIEENNIRYLLAEDCENEKDTYNFIENVLSISDNKIVVEKRNTHVGLINEKEFCKNNSKVIIY